MTLSDEQITRLSDLVHDNLGPIIQEYMDNPKCEDIVVNEDGSLWVKILGQGFKEVGSLSVIDRWTVITAVANLRGLDATHQSPVVETILPINGSRFEALLPPIVTSPVFTIRCRAKLIYTLADYVDAGIMTRAQSDYLAACIVDRKTILISGSTGSGKTTLLNAALDMMEHACPNVRLAIIEDTPELQCGIPNHNAILSSKEISMQDCLRIAMRLIPDRIVVGEVRGPECLAMLKAFNTGHPGGLATVHANNANAALLRLETLVQEAVAGYAAQRLISEAINVVVHIDGPRPGIRSRNRTIREVVVVHGYRPDNNAYVLEQVAQ